MKNIVKYLIITMVFLISINSYAGSIFAPLGHGNDEQLGYNGPLVPDQDYQVTCRLDPVSTIASANVIIKGSGGYKHKVLTYNDRNFQLIVQPGFQDRSKEYQNSIFYDIVNLTPNHGDALIMCDILSA